MSLIDDIKRLEEENGGKVASGGAGIEPGTYNAVIVGAEFDEKPQQLQFVWDFQFVGGPYDGWHRKRWVTLRGTTKDGEHINGVGHLLRDLESIGCDGLTVSDLAQDVSPVLNKGVELAIVKGKNGYLNTYINRAVMGLSVPEPEPDYNPNVEGDDDIPFG